jgi:hypothetical protein
MLLPELAAVGMLLGAVGAVSRAGPRLLAVALLGAACGWAWPSQAASLDLRADCGAVGDGKADDSLALKTCLNRFQALLSAGGPAVLHIPAGVYRITGARGAMPTIERRGGTIIGDGPHASYLKLDPTYAGDLFSWSEAWLAGNLKPPSYDPANDMSGPTVSGLQITGSTAAPAQQNAFVFYDRDDHVLLRDIEVDFLNGQCLSVGRTLRQPVAYVRESAFYNIQCFNAGTTAAAAVDVSSTSGPGSDATNEIDVFKLAIFAPRGTGVVVRNPNPASATRRVRIFGLRVEQAGGDGVVIGDAADRGQVADIDVHDLTVVEARGAALRIGAGASAPQPYQISILGGALGPGNSTAIAIDGGRLIEIDLSNIDAPVAFGARAGANINIHGNGAEAGWTYLRRPPAASR